MKLMNELVRPAAALIFLLSAASGCGRGSSPNPEELAVTAIGRID